METESSRLPLIASGMLLVVAVGGIVDLIFDDPESWLSGHVLFELALITTSLAFVAYLWRGWRRASRSLADTRRTLAERSAERDAWHRAARDALEGLGTAIDAQFEGWGLTPTEREIALGLLKGHSHKQIANLTGRSERTVRQHAVAVYGKSGLTGRAELAAFFLEGLLLPGSARAAPPVTEPGTPHAHTSSPPTR
jgi:DNA-binding CsgD family transcriptional regulator